MFGNKTFMEALFVEVGAGRASISHDVFLLGGPVNQTGLRMFD